MLEHLNSLLARGEALVEFARDAALFLSEHLATHAVVLLALEVANLLLALGNEPHCHTLHASCAQGWLDLLPQHWREFKSHDAVEHTSRLLSVDEVLVDVAWVLDGCQDCWLGNLMKDNALGVLLLQPKDFAQVPCNGFSLAVLITGEPHRLGAL